MDADRIMKVWGLSESEAASLLGQECAESQIVAIHDGLHRIFSENSDQANNWIRKPNEYFGGKSALEMMLGGDIESIRKYLKFLLYNS